MLFRNKQVRNEGRRNEFFNELRVLGRELQEKREASEKRNEEERRMSPYSEPAQNFSSRLRRKQ